MAEVMRNWRQWEMDERLAFYKRRVGSIAPRIPTSDEIARWKQECDAYIERERCAELGIIAEDR